MQLFYIRIVLFGILIGTLSAQDSPFLHQCFGHLDGYAAIKSCSVSSDNFSKCPEKEIYESYMLYDRMFATNINIKNLNKAYKHVCEKAVAMGQVNVTCEPDFKRCLLSYLRGIDSGCVHDALPCIYDEISACIPAQAILFGHSFQMIKSTACTITDYQYRLRPFYGPEKECYPNITLTTGNSSRLGPHYKQYCDQFNKDEVWKCIEDTLTETKSSHRIDDDYINGAKKFFQQRSLLCSAMERPSTKTCPKVDVSRCQEELFDKESLQKPSEVVSKIYIDCVYDKYKTCDPNLAKIIKHNLESLASRLSISFALMFSLTTILSLFF